jgi:hypothetical protein
MIYFIPLVIFFFLIYNSPRIQSNEFLLRSSCKTQNISQSSKPLSKMVVISHYEEDIDWPDLYIGEKIPHIVYTHKNDPLALHYVPNNKGREANAYLKFIVDYYSNLPQLIAFVHAHRTSWHQRDPSDIVIALRALQWNKYTYMPLNSVVTSATYKANTGDEQAAANYEFWQTFLQDKLGPPPTNGIKTYCCATFVVKREAILVHPKEFYLRINDYITNSRYSTHITSRLLEYTWHVIFGEPAHITYKTCDIFICDSQGNITVPAFQKK